MIKHVTDDSREVKKGSVFVAIAGVHTDANRFIPDVIKKGASEIVSERPPKKEWLSKVKYRQVKNAREELALLASELYGNPSKKLKVIGVTGSDGKTTTSHMIYEILKKAGKKVGLISTISAKIGGKSIDTGFHVTNPEPLELQNLLSKMVDRGLEYVVLEVTSHGIDQHRIAGIDFEVAVLTNITHEHLDYHKTFENYRDTKLKLFLRAKSSVLNKSDKSYLYFDKKIKTEKLVYSRHDPLEFEKVMSKDVAEIGEYNVCNAQAAATTALKLGIKRGLILTAIAEMGLPEGRLDEVENTKGISIIVDFAHTPNALENVLMLLRKRTKGRLIVVFGCAGERDRTKRPAMAKIATDIADISVFTAEDPRSEKIEDILNQMEKGVANKKAEYYKIPERGEAIAFAINKLAKKGDTVVACGKAHEKSMAYNGVEYPWSDFKAVRVALRGKVLEINR